MMTALLRPNILVFSMPLVLVLGLSIVDAHAQQGVHVSDSMLKQITCLQHLLFCETLRRVMHSAFQFLGVG